MFLSVRVRGDIVSLWEEGRLRSLWVDDILRVLVGGGEGVGIVVCLWSWVRGLFRIFVSFFYRSGVGMDRSGIAVLLEMFIFYCGR